MKVPGVDGLEREAMNAPSFLFTVRRQGSLKIDMIRIDVR